MSDQFTVQLTLADYVAANRAHFWTTIKRRAGIRVLLLGFWSLFGAVVFQPDYEFSWSSLLLGALIGAFAYLLFVATCLGAAYLLIPRSTRRQFNSNRRMRMATDYTVEDTLLRYASPLEQGQIPFDYLYKWSESDQAILLYPAERIFIILPKRCIDADIINRIRGGLFEVSNPDQLLPTIPS